MPFYEQIALVAIGVFLTSKTLRIHSINTQFELKMMEKTGMQEFFPVVFKLMACSSSFVVVVL